MTVKIYLSYHFKLFILKKTFFFILKVVKLKKTIKNFGAKTSFLVFEMKL
jgi:hypothetical protein